MSIVKQPTIEGFNKFLNEQKEVPGECTLTLVEFDHEYKVVFENLDIRRAPWLSDATYEPRGSTALLDAMGRTIDETGRWLASLPEYQRPAKVILVTQTDGFENTSLRYNKADVQRLVQRQQSIYKWQFVFLGANIDAIATAAQYGIPIAAAATYSSNAQGVNNAYTMVSKNIASARVGNGSVTFSDSDRASLLVDDVSTASVAVDTDKK